LLVVSVILALTGCGEMPMIHQTQTLVNSQVVVAPGTAAWSRFVITVPGRVSGSFVASGGLGNDVYAAVLDEVNLANWVNGHYATAFWSTTGAQTAGQFNGLLLPAGTYYFAFNNRMSILSPKTVSFRAVVQY
jgi:hypothetical protein